MSDAIRRYIPVATRAPEPFHTVLTIHEDDLFPVCAFHDGDGNWMRIVEGPEDVIDESTGSYGNLLRAPTHWMEAPDLYGFFAPTQARKEIAF